MASESHTTISNSVKPARKAGARAKVAADLKPCLGENGVDGLLGDGVARDLLPGEHGLKLADEVGGADHLLAEGTEKVDGAGIDHGDVHDVVVGGELHGHALGAGEHGLESGVKLLPTGIGRLAAGEGIEAGFLDAVDELARFARGGDEVVPAARDVGLWVEAEDVSGDGVAMVVIVKQPAVEVGFAEGGLDGFEVHGGHDSAYVAGECNPSSFVLDSPVHGGHP